MEFSQRFEGLTSPATARLLARFLADSDNCLAAQLDGTGILVSANVALQRHLGDPGPGRALSDALTADSVERWHQTMAELDAPGSAQTLGLRFSCGASAGVAYRCLVVRSDNGLLWLFAEPMMALPTGESSEIEQVLHRLARLERAWAEADRLARTDPLTGLANRRQADAWLEEIGRLDGLDAGALACLMVDLDQLKEVNDAFGHTVGDRLLRAVASALAENVRDLDRVARHGGDEFLVLLPGIDQAHAKPLAERLRARLGSLVVPPVDRPLTVSIGAACSRAGDRPDVLRDRADAALLLAKRAGRNRVEFL